MRKVITKSETILNEDIKAWEDVLIVGEFPKQHMNLAAEYCDFHAKLEASQGISKETDGITTLPISLNILSRLNLDNVKEYAISDEVEEFQQSKKLLTAEAIELRDALVNVDAIMDFVYYKLCDDIVKEINEKIEASENKILDLGCLLKSIMTIAEKTMAQVIAVKYCYCVK